MTRAVESPLVRGGLTIGIGILTGNVLGFARVALTAYLLGTHSRADSLAVAMGPIDTLNSVLINSIVFAFVPMLTERQGAGRVALFHKLLRGFTRFFAGLSLAVILTAPWLMRVLAPGLDPAFHHDAVNVLRILSLSTVAAGIAAVHCARLYTDRRFAPSAFYQATLNVGTVAGALSLWNWLGVYGFAIGYSAGAWAQLTFLHFTARTDLGAQKPAACPVAWREILSRPLFFLLYAGGVALNITFTRAYATHAGPGLAAALDYCMRGVGVPLAFLVSPISNSLLPEIARLRSLGRIRDACRLIDKTMALAALAAVGVCAFAVAFRRPAIEILFERGSFTAQSTELVSAVFLGLGPSLIGWSLLEISSRTLFSLGRHAPPVLAALVPVLINVAFTFGLHEPRPQFLGVGAALGLLGGFALLYALSHNRRLQWRDAR